MDSKNRAEERRQRLLAKKQARLDALKKHAEDSQSDDAAKQAKKIVQEIENPVKSVENKEHDNKAQKIENERKYQEIQQETELETSNKEDSATNMMVNMLNASGNTTIIDILGYFNKYKNVLKATNFVQSIAIYVLAIILALLQVPHSYKYIFYFKLALNFGICIIVHFPKCYNQFLGLVMCSVTTLTAGTFVVLIFAYYFAFSSQINSFLSKHEVFNFLSFYYNFTDSVTDL